MKVWLVLYEYDYNATSIIDACASEEIAKSIAENYYKEYCGSFQSERVKNAYWADYRYRDHSIEWDDSGMLIIEMEVRQ